VEDIAQAGNKKGSFFNEISPGGPYRCPLILIYNVAYLLEILPVQFAIYAFVNAVGVCGPLWVEV